MLRNRKTRIAASMLTLALLATACSSRDDDDDEASTGGDGETAESSDIPTEDCVSDPTAEVEGDTITLASSYPQSGQYAAYSEIARGWKAYFDKVNAEGGVEIGGDDGVGGFPGFGEDAAEGVEEHGVAGADLVHGTGHLGRTPRAVIAQRADEVGHVVALSNVNRDRAR